MPSASDPLFVCALALGASIAGCNLVAAIDDLEPTSRSADAHADRPRRSRVGPPIRRRLAAAAQRGRGQSRRQRGHRGRIPGRARLRRRRVRQHRPRGSLRGEARPGRAAPLEPPVRRAAHVHDHSAHGRSFRRSSSSAGSAAISSSAPTASPHPETRAPSSSSSTPAAPRAGPGPSPAARRNARGARASTTSAKSSSVASTGGAIQSPSRQARARITSLGSQDAFVADFSISGKLQWLRSYGGTAYQRGSALAVDGDVIYLAGTTNGDVDFDGVMRTSKGASDVFVVKLDATGDHPLQRHPR